MKETIYDELRSGMFGFEYAKPCPKCNQYYPGDCYHHGCGDDKCRCDGCIIHFSISELSEEDFD